MPISTNLNTKIRLTMLCLSGFELYSRWVPLSLCDRLRSAICDPRSSAIIWKTALRQKLCW